MVHEEPEMLRVDQPSRYATVADFCHIFDEEMDSLYRLSQLLTAQCEKAERCFLSALEECIGMQFIFQEYAQSWAWRSIITNAIGLTNPCIQGHRGEIQASRDIEPVVSDGNQMIAHILALDDLQRLVVVMSGCERYGDQECAVMLRCSHKDVRKARAEAFRHIETTCGIQEKKCSTVLRAWIAMDSNGLRCMAAGFEPASTGLNRVPSGEDCS